MQGGGPQGDMMGRFQAMRDSIQAAHGGKLSQEELTTMAQQFMRPPQGQQPQQFQQQEQGQEQPDQGNEGRRRRGRPQPPSDEEVPQ